MFQYPHSHKAAPEISISFSGCSSNQQKPSGVKQLRHNDGMLLNPDSVRAWTMWCPKSIGLQETPSSCKAWSTVVDGCSGTSWLPEPGKEEQCLPAQTSVRGVTLLLLLGLPSWASCGAWESQALPCSCRGRACS